MARVTVEDCIVRIPNRFQLVMTAAQRSRELSVGAELTVDRDNDKNPVVALREIADETINVEELESALIRGLQKNVEADEPVEEGDDFLAAEEALSDFAAMGLGGASAPGVGDLDGDDDGEGSMVVGFEDIGEVEAEAEAAGEEPEES